MLNKLIKYFDELNIIKNKISSSLLSNPSFEINQGNIFQDNYNSEIAELRNISTNSKDWILNYQAEQITQTQISNLKVKFNSVFGYFIEVSNSQTSKVPENYIRKQTIAGGERYITSELKDMEQKILTADEKLIGLEKELFLKFREEFIQHIQTLQKVSQIIAEVDTLFSFSEVAKENNYTRPIFTEKSQVLAITSNRHPVVEKLVENFTSNDLNLNSQNSMMILTGPNMSGKSTYIRQVALLAIMAQIGSLVPAESCELSLVDRVFTRVGASDNLSKGESTFMVEMNETANILNNATSNSLLILDEIGRGTSTFDGVAIAWSVMKYIYENLKCRTLFATHYLELTELEKKYDGISNYSVQIAEKNDQVIFMHKIIPGKAQKSFGVHVAEIAGMPNEVINNAKEILKSFEDSQNKVKKVVNKKINSEKIPQMGLFE
ncbi:DNA mismatch repair protein MutS [bacterium]|nr:MAG: DNA mismatch repair protein MutS [bacterium]